MEIFSTSTIQAIQGARRSGCHVPRYQAAQTLTLAVALPPSPQSLIQPPMWNNHLEAHHLLAILVIRLSMMGMMTSLLQPKTTSGPLVNQVMHETINSVLFTELIDSTPWSQWQKFTIRSKPIPDFQKYQQLQVTDHVRTLQIKSWQGQQRFRRYVQHDVRSFQTQSPLKTSRRQPWNLQEHFRQEEHYPGVQRVIVILQESEDLQRILNEGSSARGSF